MGHLLISPKSSFRDSNGDPLASGKVYTYAAGTSTPLASYTDKGEGTANANPVILDSRGEASIWLGVANYKVVLKDSDDVTIWTVDNIKSMNDASIVTAMIADDAITTAKIADGAVTADKLGTGFYGLGESVEKTADYTATINDDIVLVKALSENVTISLPAASVGINKVITVKRIDDTDIKTDTFIDGDVTVSSETINVGSHPLYNLQRIQLTSSGTLPAGLSLATDYYVIKVDANNIKLASSVALAVLGTSVDITAAAGGGTHTITSQRNTVTIDGYLTETIDGNTTFTLQRENEGRRMYCDGTEWFAIGHTVKDPLITNLGLESSGLVIEENSGKISFKVGGVEIHTIDASGFSANAIKTADILDEAITIAKMSAVAETNDGTDPGVGGISRSDFIVSVSTTSLTLVNATGLSTILTVTGNRPVLIYVDGKDGSAVSTHNTTIDTAKGSVSILRGSTNLSGANFGINATEDPIYALGGDAPAPGFMVMDFPSAGTYTYKVQFKSLSATSTTTSFNYTRLIAFEL